MIVLTLPYSPSVNNCYGSRNGRRFLKPSAIKYRATVTQIVQQARAYAAEPLFDGEIAIRAVLNPPMGQRVDIDNPMKILLDSLTHAHLWHDDSQVKLLLTMFAEPVDKGSITLTVASLEEIEMQWRNPQ